MAVELNFRLPTLEDLEEGRGEALSLGIYADELPPRGLAGALDWRLCGRLSRLLREGTVSGDAGESVMLPGRSRLAYDRVFLHGLGASRPLDAASARVYVRRMLCTVADADVRTSALVLPGRSVGERRIAIEALLQIADDFPSLDELTLPAPVEEQRLWVGMLEGRRRKARALE